MSNVTLLAIDLAKNVFQLHGTDAKGKAILKKKISRLKLLEFIAGLKPCNIYMEACGSANYWGRKFREHGHKVKLINPKYVKPYVKRNKNDVNDAAGIAAAARDPDMRFCEVKSEEQQDIQSVHRIRSLLIQQRTALANQIRGLLAEYGIVIPRGTSYIRSTLPEILSNNPNDMGGLIFTCLMELYDRFVSLDKQIAQYDKKIEGLFKSNEACQRLEKIPGIGALGATILASILGNGSSFKNGRHFAAFLGLTPRQHSSGGKERILGISKGGDSYIRSLLIHGSRAVILWASKKTDRQSMWIKSLKARRGYNKTAVALANKIARTAWAIIKEGANYNANHKPVFLKTA
jgi:transposase